MPLISHSFEQWAERFILDLLGVLSQLMRMGVCCPRWTFKLSWCFYRGSETFRIKPVRPVCESHNRRNRTIFSFSFVFTLLVKYALVALNMNSVSWVWVFSMRFCLFCKCFVTNCAPHFCLLSAIRTCFFKQNSNNFKLIWCLILFSFISAYAILTLSR